MKILRIKWTLSQIYQTVLDKWWGLAGPNRPIPMSSKQLNSIDFLKV